MILDASDVFFTKNAFYYNLEKKEFAIYLPMWFFIDKTLFRRFKNNFIGFKFTIELKSYTGMVGMIELGNKISQIFENLYWVFNSGSNWNLNYCSIINKVRNWTKWNISKLGLYAW